MTRCASEDRYPAAGPSWSPPDPLPLRIETPRLIARPYAIEDAETLFRTIDAEREGLLPWMAWARDDHRDVERSLHFIVNNRMHVRDPGTMTHVVFGLFDRETGELVGGHGIHDIRRNTASCETGYWTRPSMQRRGYATEATRHVISWALRPQDAGGLGLRRVRIYCAHSNEPSRRIPQRLGLRQEVEQRDDYWVEGVGLTTRLGWGVMADEWDTGANALRA